MMEKGNEHINKNYATESDTILVLGNAGAGKTTFVQFMAGDNEKLISKEIDSDTAEYLIEDGNKIGTSATESNTLYPEQVLQNSKTSFSDTPGFSDTRSPTYEIITSYVLKKYLKDIKTVKIVLLVTYNSVQLGVYKDDFINLLKNLNSFLKNIEHFKNSIVLVATKVPNLYKATNINTTLISSENIIKSIAKYLYEVERSLKEKLSKTLDINEHQFIKNAITVLNTLQETDDKENYKRINIFRRPSKPGVLNDLPVLQTNKVSIQKTIFNNIFYTAISQDDIGYTLSSTAKNHLDCLLRYVNNRIRDISSEIFKIIINHYKTEINNYTDIYKLLSDLKRNQIRLQTLKSDLENTHCWIDYISYLNNFLSNENITLKDNLNFEINDIYSYVNKMELFSDTSVVLSPVMWAAKMTPVINYIKDSVLWYDVLRKIFVYLSSYKVQELKLKLYNETVYENNQEKESLYKILLSNSEFLSDKYINEYFRTVSLTDKKITELEDVISLTMKLSLNITCDSDGELTITGVFVKVTEINTEALIKHYCGRKTLQVIVIRAVNTVFIDGDFDASVFNGVDMIIMAPKWEVIGARKINLDGNPGQHHIELPINSYTSDEQNGANGLPGNPGKNGGNFLGIGIDFINGLALSVTANGGTGGEGQDGGNGKNGREGKSASEFIGNIISEINTDLLEPLPDTQDWYIFNNSTYSCYYYEWNSGAEYIETALSDALLIVSNDHSESLDDNQWEKHTVLSSHLLKDISQKYCSSRLRIYTCTGEDGSNGGNGGNGGSGGIGGNPGKILINELGDPSKIHTESNYGSNGNPGRGGVGGNKGKTGTSVSCYKIKVHNHEYGSSSKIYWRCTEDALHERKVFVNGLAGLSNYTIDGILRPDSLRKFNYFSTVIDYFIELKKYINNRFLSHSTSKFESLILNKKTELFHDDVWMSMMMNNLQFSNKIK
ncbi:uncharacterized protein LOC142330526 [Lycorma delicatula]|uniref:uncharacterized protein LOC142330526 n=1 Tax=Lycorma delicatula TaxID=130591 RepID=UPI003F5136E6